MDLESWQCKSEKKAIAVLEHTPYLLDVALSDFFASKIKKTLKGMYFYDIKSNTMIVLKVITQIQFQICFK